MKIVKVRGTMQDRTDNEPMGNVARAGREIYISFLPPITFRRPRMFSVPFPLAAAILRATAERWSTRAAA